MSASEAPELDALLRRLRAENLDIRVDPRTGVLVVPPRGAGGPTAVVDIPEELLVEWLDVPTGPGDPRGAARGTAMVNVLAHLTTDHVGGVNQVRRLSLVRDDQGVHFVEERADDPGPAPGLPSPGRPHDDLEVFAARLEALAEGLRTQGLDAEAAPAASTIEVGTRGRGDDARPVIVELRPDLFRRYLDEQEAEYEAIGGDPRARAWTAWWWTLAHALLHGVGLTPPADLWRLSFVRSAEGQVELIANTDGTTPSGPPYEWSAEPPSGR